MKKLLSFFILTFVCLSLYASPVKPEKALQVAKNFAARYVKGADRLEASVVYTHPMPKSGQPAMYVVNLGSAFVIVSADDVAHPVLGYSTGRAWPTKQTLPSQITYYLDDLAAQIESAAGSLPDRETVTEWEALSSPKFLLSNTSLPDSVGPLLTTTWNQGQYYNALCPEDPNGIDGHCVTGCVATAMAQIINYWGYPIHGRGTHSYNSGYGTLTVNYDSASYDYAHMPDALTATSTTQEVQAVATLMRDCGVAANMGYSPNESGSYDVDARAGLINFFRLSPDLSYAEKTYFTNVEWEGMLRSDIAANRPVLYSGHGDNGGHTFVCDGYKQDGYFHYNFGWGGYADGWYLTSAVNPAGMAFNSDQSALFGIVPDSTGNVILGQMTGTSTFTIDDPLEFYHLLGHNIYTGTSYSNACNNTVNFISAISANQLVANIISYQEQTVQMRDASGNLLRNITPDGNNDASPVLTSDSSLTIEYSGSFLYNGFKIAIQQNGNCRMVSNVTASVDTTTVVLSWKENGLATGWQVEYGVAGHALGEGTIVNVSDTTIAIGGLVGLEEYAFYIRPQCGGMWYGPIKIKTRSKYWIDVVQAQPEGFSQSSELDQHGRYPIIISSAEGLAWWAKQVIEQGSTQPIAHTTVNLAADIDLGEYLWKPVTEFYGDFCGNGHVVSNMKIIENDGDPNYGFFASYRGYTNENRSTISDLTFQNPYIECADGVYGVLAARISYASVRNCGVNSGTIFQYEHQVDAVNRGTCGGGLIGYVMTADIANCYAAGTLTSMMNSACYGVNGGFIGTMNGYDCSLINNYCAVRVIAEAGWTGSICAYMEGGEIHNCYGVNYNLPFIGFNNNVYGSTTDTMRIDRESFRLNDSVYFDGIGYLDLLAALNKKIEFENDSNWRVWQEDSLWLNNGFPTLGDKYTVSCPNVENLVAVNASNASGYAVHLSWDSGVIQANFMIKYWESDSLDITASYVTADTNAVELTNLTLGRMYNICVRQYCDEQHHGGWSTPVQVLFDKPYWTDVVTSQPEGYIEDADGNVIITSAEGLAWLSCLVNGLHGQTGKKYLGKTVTLMADIDLSQYKWRPIGYSYDYTFQGSFDGKDHSICNLYVNERSIDVGLFGRVFQRIAIPQVKFKNIRMVNPVVKGESNAGAILGHFHSNQINPMVLFDNCHATGVSIEGNYEVGGIMGYSEGSGELTIRNCSSSGVVRGIQYIGGILGDMSLAFDKKITNCYSSCTVYSFPIYPPLGFSGGIIGYIGDCFIQNVYSTGVVENTGMCSGKLVGCLHNGSGRYLYGLRNSNQWPLIGSFYLESSASDTSFFSENGVLETTISIGNSSLTNLLDALNAWVDTYDTIGIYRRWASDTVGENGGFPVFEAIRHYTISLNVADSTPYGNVSGAGQYGHRETATIEAKPNSGYHFVNWSDGSVENPRTIILTQDTTITALFAKNLYIVTGNTTAGTDYYIDFEDASFDELWSFMNDEYPNQWYINSLGDTNRALFVSSDGGESYIYIAGYGAYVFAYTTLYLTPGQYGYSFDWRCNGQADWNYLRVALLPGWYIPNQGEWSYNSLPGYAIPLDNGSQLVSHIDWTAAEGNFSITEEDEYKLVFYWHDNREGLQPPAAVDNISLHNNTFDDYSYMGYVMGSDTVPFLDTVTLTAIPNNGYSFSHWNDGNTDNPRMVIATKHQQFRAIFQEYTPVTVSDSITVCDSYTWHGTVYTADAVLTDTLSTIGGCDSIVSHYLFVHHSSTGDTSAMACDNYTWYQHTGITESTDSLTHTFAGANIQGCDSTVTLHLTVNHNTSSVETVTACDSTVWHGNTYYASTNVPTYTTTNAAGCDSTVTLHLTINRSNTSDTTATACDIFTWWNTNYTNSTNTPTHVYTNAQGCDSTVTLHLTVNRSDTTVETVTACDSYTWHGTTYTASTDLPTYATTNRFGCDSTITLHLTMSSTFTTTDNITACDSYSWHGTTYTASNNTATYLALGGDCDSIYTLNLTLNYSSSYTDVQTSCDTYTWHGDTYTASTNTPTYITTNAAGCDSTVTLHLTIRNSSTSTQTVTACDSYIWNGTTYTASTNTPFVTLINAAGCDSTATLNLTVNYSNTGMETVTACDSYTWHGTTYTSSNTTATYTSTNKQGCDSTVTLNLTINYSTTSIETVTVCNSYNWHGTTYTASTNTPTYTSTNAAGCDSVTTLHLSVNHSSHNAYNQHVCDSYTWHGTPYTATGTYTYDYTNDEGCASTDTLHLTVDQHSDTAYHVTACNSYNWNNTLYTQSGIYYSTTTSTCTNVDTLYLTINYSSTGVETVTACDSYTWHGTNYTASISTPTYTSTNAQGCDSVTTLHLTINNSNSAIVTVTACDSYTWHDSVFTTSGTHTYLTINVAGCDSVTTLNLTINTSTTSIETVTACDSAVWHGNTYYASTNVPTYTTTNAAGCDSTVTLHLTVNRSSSGTETVSACETFTWHGNSYTASTNTPTFTTTNTAGCDSVTTLHLTVNHASTGIETVTACDSYTWHGATYTFSTDLPTFVTTNRFGCDSTITLHLTMGSTFTATENVNACDSYTWRGTAYSAGGIYERTVTSAIPGGCDSVFTLNLTLGQSNSSTDVQTACNSYFWHGNTYNASTNTPTFTATNVSGCDSVVTLNLTVNYSSTYTDVQTACDSYVWNGTTYTASTNTPFVTLVNATGCDSVATLDLTVNYSTSSVETVIACNSYTWVDGITYTASTNTPTYTTTNAAGCDSTVTLHLTVNQCSSTVVTACDSYTWHGVTYTESGTYSSGSDTLQLTVNHSTTGDTTATACDNFTWWNTNYTSSTDTPTHVYTNAVGCDSTVTLHLTVNYSTTVILMDTACEAYFWDGEWRYSSGQYINTTTNAAGCDSIATLNLTINNPVNTATTVTACDSYTWQEAVITTSGTYHYTHTDTHGCTQDDTLYLTINHNDTVIVDEEVCDSLTWYGVTYTASAYGVQYLTVPNVVGCDSIFFLDLTVNYTTYGEMSAVSCDSYQWDWNGAVYTASGDYTYRDTVNMNSQFCDSVLTLHLTVNYSATSDTTATACDMFVWYGHMGYDVSGDYEHRWWNVTADGCDSILTLHLTINRSAETTVTDTAEASYTWNGTTYTESGTYQWQGTTAEGCDSTVTLNLTITHTEGIGDVFDNPDVSIHVTGNSIEILGAEGMEVRMFDIVGRQFHHEDCKHSRIEIRTSSLPAGIYLVKVGTLPARRVVVIR